MLPTPSQRATICSMLDVSTVKNDFPILTRQIKGHPLVYLDNAATSQKPQVVIDAISDYYQNHNANVHRGIHTLGDESTRMYQEARETVAHFIGAKDPHELIFTRNTTEAINLVAFSWGLQNLKPDDQIIVTELEHHSNLVTWQRVCELTGAKLVHLPVDGNGDLALDYLQSLVNQSTKLVALTHVSNVLGTVVDVQHVAKEIKRHSQAKIMVDGAQSAPHMPIHVHDLNIDFFAFSGHKMCGPMGIGGLWVKKDILKNLDPFLVGGGMIDQVSKQSSSWAELPDRFDAGTPNVADAVGLAAACDYLKNIGMIEIQEHERELTKYALEKFTDLENQNLITLYGSRDHNKRAGIITFNINGVHAHDVAQILDRESGVAIRSGHHCNQILLESLETTATARASFYLYNTPQDIDTLIEGINKVKQIFKN
jgi:cysteine desulfurase / selenocysteine lyase